MATAASINAIAAGNVAAINGITALGQVNNVDWPAGGVPILLDAFPGAVAAYSMARLLRTGATNAFRAFYNSGANNIDIGFTGANVTDTSTLLSTVGGGSANIGTLYDQTTSGANLAQSTDANRPKVVDTGSLVTVNSIVAGRYEGSHTLNTTAATPSFGTTLGLSGNLTTSIFIVHRKTDLNAGFLFGWGNTGAGLAAIGLYDDNSLIGIAFAGGNTRTISAYSTATHYLTTIIKTPGAINTTCEVRRNGVSIVIGGSGNTPNVNGGFPLVLGAWANSGSLLSGHVQELVIYASDETSDVADIEANIMSFYGI